MRRSEQILSKMIVGLNGKTIGEFAVDAEYPAKKMYTLEFSGKANPKNKISLTFPNDFYDPTNEEPRRRDRNLYIERIEISEPPGVSFPFFRPVLIFSVNGSPIKLRIKLPRHRYCDGYREFTELPWLRLRFLGTKISIRK